MTVKLNVPATVGVPNTAPVVALIPMPLGRPLADQLYGVWPPVAVTACCAAYPTPTVAVGGLSAVVVIVSVEVAAETVIDSPFDAVCCGLPLSWTVTVKLNVPATVGVPNTAPDVALIPMPFGRPLADQLYGVWPPVAVTACCAAYPTPTVAVGGLSAVVVIVSVEAGVAVAELLGA